MDNLFGEKSSQDEIVPNYLNKQKFSNPLKNLFYNIILRENLNSYESVKRFLKQFSENVIRPSAPNETEFFVDASENFCTDSNLLFIIIYLH